MMSKSYFAPEQSASRIVPAVREAHDAEHHDILKDDPSNDDARIDIALDESFPTSDAPSHSRPGSGNPAPSSGYNEAAETKIRRRRKRRIAAKSTARIAVPLSVAGALLLVAGLRLLRADGD